MNIQDMIQALNEGEQAKAKLPELERGLRSVTSERDNAQAHSQELELKITNYRDQIDGLLGKVRSLEVERDDAGFRELEAQERVATLLKAVRVVSRELDATALQVDPPKVVEPAPSPVAPQAREGNVEPSPTVPFITTQSENVGSSGAPSTENAGIGTPQGQSESSPTASGEGIETNVSQNAQSGHSGAPSTGVSSGDTAPSDTRPWWEKEADDRAKAQARDDYNRNR